MARRRRRLRAPAGELRAAARAHRGPRIDSHGCLARPRRHLQRVVAGARARRRRDRRIGDPHRRAAARAQNENHLWDKEKQAMSSLPVGPVAWSDGMLIETQHFQQLERHLAHQAALRLGQTSNHGWGFTLLDLDQDGLGLGRLGLRHARGVFQDGTAFSLPSDDP
ncbi:type VI secretion system baseplate subunit TssK, partial [Burkholderia thailandensis]|uniref:type VI secretion system baseplate subunit TssK n=1 Tax=Burkholderia thailandensis TaxID=57975 RepID=UPI0021C57F73